MCYDYLKKNCFATGNAFLIKEEAQQIVRSRIRRSYHEECVIEGCDAEEKLELAEELREVLGPIQIPATGGPNVYRT